MDDRSPSIQHLIKAVDEQRLVFDYQPKVDMNTGLVCGAEALIRWRPESGKVIPPDRFIPLAEQSGYIVELTRRLFPLLLRDIAVIQGEAPEMNVSFNASARNIADDAFIEDVARAVRTGRVAPGTLEIEVTETAANGDPALLSNLATLAELNVGVAMDDFGQGYASIDAMGRLPFSTIKLDQAIIRRIARSRKDLIIVESTINLAHQLGLTIVAEGVETAEMFQTLQLAGCGMAQGFWIAKPMRLASFVNFLRQPLQWSVMPVGQIHMVQIDQLRWRKAMIDAALSYLHVRKGKPASLQRIPELHPLKSPFGQWYYGPGRRFVGTRWFDALERPHLAAHKTGRLIVNALKAREPDARVHALLDQLTKLSGVIVHMLAQLEDHLVSKVSRRTTTTVRAVSDTDLQRAARQRQSQ